MSLAVTAAVADISQWASYLAAIVMLALTYAMTGVLLAPLFGRVAGVLSAFLIPFTGPLLIALAWLASTTIAAGTLFRRNMRTARNRRHGTHGRAASQAHVASAVRALRGHHP